MKSWRNNGHTFTWLVWSNLRGYAAQGVDKSINVYDIFQIITVLWKNLAQGPFGYVGRSQPILVGHNQTRYSNKPAGRVVHIIERIFRHVYKRVYRKCADASTFQHLPWRIRYVSTFEIIKRWTIWLNCKWIFKSKGMNRILVRYILNIVFAERKSRIFHGHIYLDKFNNPIIRNRVD